MPYKYEHFKSNFPGHLFRYGNASHAFYDILIWLKKNRPADKPNIVLPVYIPAKLYRFILAAGYEPIFYDVTRECQFDPAVVAGKINDQTRAVLAIHYFGVPAPIKELKQHTEKADVFLIEDCVHTLNSEIDGSLLGSIGDGAIFSIRKMMQLPSGGFLTLNNPGHCESKFEPSWEERVRSVFTGYYLAASRLKYKYYQFTKGKDPLGLAWIPRSGYINFSDEQFVNVKRMSRLSEHYLNSVDIEWIINKRRSNLEYLLNGIKDIKYLESVIPQKFIKERSNGAGPGLCLTQGFVPFSFPVLVPAGSREMLQYLMCKKGIGCSAGWPEAPFHHEKFKNAKLLSARLLELPIHQGINEYQLKLIIECLKTYQLEENLEFSFKIQSQLKPAFV